MQKSRKIVEDHKALLGLVSVMARSTCDISERKRLIHDFLQLAREHMDREDDFFNNSTLRREDQFHEVVPYLTDILMQETIAVDKWLSCLGVIEHMLRLHIKVEEFELASVRVAEKGAGKSR